MKDRISTIVERWYISEPALFRIVCTHDIKENGSMSCPVRSGKRTIEFNPAYIDEMSDVALEQALRTEAIRILLKHPYQRKPDACSQQAIAVGSNITIGDNYHFGNFNIERPADFELTEGQAYEWYSRRIQEMLPSSDWRSDKLREAAEQHTALSELWEEDELSISLIDGVIESTREWGSLTGKFAEKLKASAGARINWRNILSGFRASILSSSRKLTRMRPNRRSGFENMGSIRRFDTKLLVAVDVSGSITSEDLSYFYGVINSAFRYGFTQVDVIQFDHGLRLVHTLKKAMKEVPVIGRGGTSFQEPIDYADKEKYDGLIILTDGYAPQPRIPDNMSCKIAWVCCNRHSYEHNHSWMERSGRVCTMELQ